MLARKAHQKRLLFELGGNDVFVVLPDSDIEEAATLAAQGAFGNAGQRCTAIKRVLVAEEIADAFAERLSANARDLVCGDPYSRKTDVGPVISEDIARVIETRVTRAIQDGASLLAGHERRGAVYTPTVLDHVKPTSELVMSETFGPVAPIIRFQSIDDAIQIANSTGYGLSAGICTNHWPSALQFIQRLRGGSINIGEVPSYRTEISPFGGIGKSGGGLEEGLRHALLFYTNEKTVSVPWI
jgi:aldehyde dehydrogenase (NAD+)